MNRTAPMDHFMIPEEAVTSHYKCVWAGADQIVVWEHLESFLGGLPPDYSCCLRCEEMIDNRTGEVLT